MSIFFDATVGIPRRWVFVRQTGMVSVAVGVIGPDYVALASDACYVDASGNVSAHIGKVVKSGPRLAAITGVISFSGVDFVAGLTAALAAAESLSDVVSHFERFAAPFIRSILDSFRNATGDQFPDIAFGLLLAEKTKSGPQLLHVELVFDGQRTERIVHEIRSGTHRLMVGAVGATSGISGHIEPLLSELERLRMVEMGDPRIIQIPQDLEGYIDAAIAIVEVEIDNAHLEEAPLWWPTGVPVVYGPVSALGV